MAKLELTIYDEPKVIPCDTLSEEYPDEGYIYCREKKDQIEIYAFISGKVQTNKDKTMMIVYQKEANEKGPEGAIWKTVGQSLRIVMLKTPILYKSEADFYADEEIENRCKEISKWNLYEPFILFDSQNISLRNNGAVIVYGFAATTLEEIKSFEERYPVRLRFLRLTTFHEEIKRLQIQKGLNKVSTNPKERKLLDSITEFVERPDAYRILLNKLNDRVLGQEQLHIVAQNVFYWLRGLSRGINSKNNTILVAPSGCGKTELFRALKAILEELIGEIPVVIKDLSQLTTEGFKGNDTKFLMAELLKANTNGIGIVMLDEADKKIMPCHTNSGEDVNRSIQGQILTLIEGKVCYENENSSSGNRIDTNNTLFIAAGAFQFVRDEKRTKKKTSLGFGVLEQMEEEQEEIITREDMIRAGALPEFIGRFGSVINFTKLNKESVGIIAKRFASDLSRIIDYEVVITDSGVDYLYEEFLKTDMGCRMLNTWLYEPIYKISNKMLLEDCSRKGGILYYNSSDNITVEWSYHEKAC